jgi:hypothetical protein
MDNFNFVIEKVIAGDYATKVEFVPRKVDKEKWEAYRNAEHQCFLEFHTDLRTAFEGEVGRKLSDKVWATIFHELWEEGHASGYHEVCNYAVTIADIVKAVIEG